MNKDKRFKITDLKLNEPRDCVLGMCYDKQNKYYCNFKYCINTEVLLTSCYEDNKDDLDLHYGVRLYYGANGYDPIKKAAIKFYNKWLDGCGEEKVTQVDGLRYKTNSIKAMQKWMEDRMDKKTISSDGRFDFFASQACTKNGTVKVYYYDNRESSEEYRWCCFLVNLKTKKIGQTSYAKTCEGIVEDFEFDIRYDSVLGNDVWGAANKFYTNHLSENKGYEFKKILIDGEEKDILTHCSDNGEIDPNVLSTVPGVPDSLLDEDFVKTIKKLRNHPLSGLSKLQKDHVEKIAKQYKDLSSSLTKVGQDIFNDRGEKIGSLRVGNYGSPEKVDTSDLGDKVKELLNKDAITTEELLEGRAKTHGKYSDNARVYCMLKSSLWKEYGKVHGEDELNVLSSCSDFKLMCEYKMTIDNICLKLARAISNPLEIDNFRDIAGYATLMVKELEKEND